MRLAARILTGLLALIALVTGGLAIVKGIYGAGIAPQMDNDFRYFGGVWMGVGAGLAYCAYKIEESTLLLRFLMLAVMIGGVGRALGLMHYPIEKKFAVGIAIELIVPALSIWLQTAMAKKQ